MNKIFKLMLGSTGILSASLFLTSCGDNKTLDENAIFDYNMVSGISLLSNTETNNGAKLTSSSEDITDEEKQIIIDNLAIVEDTLNSGIVKSEIKESDNPDYQYYYTLSTKTLTGTDDVYKFYYNGTIKKEKKTDDDNELEEEINGICYINDELYEVTGKRQKDEDEEELKLEIRLDKENYVKIQAETDTDEADYKFELFKNGKLTFKSKVEYDIDDNGDIELEFKTQKSEGEFRFGYDLYKKNNETYIDVEIKKNGGNIKKTIKVVVLDDEITYVFM